MTRPSSETRHGRATRSPAGINRRPAMTDQPTTEQHIEGVGRAEQPAETQVGELPIVRENGMVVTAAPAEAEIGASAGGAPPAAATDASTAAPAAETPAPETPAPETPAPETPAAETPA